MRQTSTISSSGVIAAVLAIAVGCGDNGNPTGPTHDWPMARVNIAERGCFGACTDLELLVHESRMVTLHDGETRTVQYLFVRGLFPSEITGAPVWFVSTYLKVNEGNWGPLFLDSAKTSQGFESAPSLSEGVAVMETWTFRDDLRGTLLGGTIFFDAWERAFGERPELAYPDL